MAVLLTPPYQQFFDGNGKVLSGGKVYTYAAGTTTSKETYTDATGTIPATNPVILDSAGRCTMWGVGVYKIVVRDENDNLIEQTDNVTSFNATTSTTEGFYQSFSGDGETTAFTLDENLGTDEKALTIYAELECITNGTFSVDSGWTKGSGWSVGSGVATATGAISTALEQNSAVTLVEGKLYSVEYTITRSAGSITLSLGGKSGSSRSSSGTYTETIIAGDTQSISLSASSFTGTVDNVSIREVGGSQYIPPTYYTVNGTDLVFTIPIAIGTNNVSVTAPYTLIGAAGAAQVAADDAIAAKSAAETAANTATTKAAEVSSDAVQVAADKATTETARDEAVAAQTGLSDALEKAEQWAEEDEDTEVETGKYSSKHYAAKAEASAALAGSLTTTGELANLNTVGTDQIDDEAVTFQKLNSSIIATQAEAQAASSEKLTTPERVQDIVDYNTTSIRSIPQNEQSANYTLVASDAGKHIYHPTDDTAARTFTIPANSAVAYAVGTAITFVNDNASYNVTIAITTDTLVLAADGSTGSRTLEAYGTATALKVSETRWIISGAGLS